MIGPTAYALKPEAGNHLGNPSAVVRKYCDADLKGARLSSDGHTKYGLDGLVSWDQEPGWDSSKIVSGYRIVSVDQQGDSATVKVEWDVLGAGSCTVVPGAKKETLNYRLSRAKGQWKIDGPMTPPHASPKALAEYFKGMSGSDCASNFLSGLADLQRAAH